MNDQGIRREVRDGGVFYRADEPVNGRTYDVHLSIVCPRHETEMVLRDAGPECYCPDPECDLEVLVRVSRRGD